jgi:radical SAM superfamily enzyme YgiQ (UPF0313 family)
MWLAYATGVLEKAGHICRLIDAPAEGLDTNGLIGEISGFNPDMIVIDTSTPSIHNDIEIATYLKEQYSAFTVLVGTHVSALPRETLEINREIDAVALGEYELTLNNVAETLQEANFAPSKDDLSKIDGICFRWNGEIIENQLRKLSDNLDAFPFISETYRKHLDYTKYFYAHSRYPIVTIVTGRGCPFKCIYCVYPQVFSGHKVRCRSVVNVVDEIEYILREFPDIKEIMFEDDTLTLNKKRCFEFAEEILKRNLKFKWSANSRADVDLETMKILKKAGARLFCVGIESSVQGILDDMKKNLNVDRIKQFFKDAKKAGILIHGCFLLGNPGETKQTLAATFKFAKQLNPDTAQFFPIMVYPGTEAYDWALENDYLKTTNFKEWLTPRGLHNCVVSRPGLTDRDLVEFCDKARTRFYLRPTYIFKKLVAGLTNPNEFKRLYKGASHLFKHIGKQLYKNDFNNNTCL